MKKAKQPKTKADKTMPDETFEVLENFELDISDPEQIREKLSAWVSAHKYLSCAVWFNE